MFTGAIQLDRKLSSDVKPHPAALNNPDVFGIELELEGRGLLADLEDKLGGYFVTHVDHSLRTLREDSEAYEYVFEKPLSYVDTMKAIKLLFDHLNSEKAEVFDSYRTSFHVHINCAAETYRTIYNLITLSIIFDELFVSQNGDHRVGNNFCLRAKDAQAQIVDLCDTIEKSQGYLWNLNPNLRYSSTNFMSLLKFGTIEYRSLECTTDRFRVKHWIDTLQKLKVFARTLQNPKDIIQMFSQKDLEQFVVDVLGEQAPYYIKVPGYKEMLVRGMRLAQDFAFCSTWVSEPVKENQAPVKKKLGKPVPLNGMFNIDQVAAFYNAAEQPQPLHFVNLEGDEDDAEIVDIMFGEQEDEDEDF